MNPGPNLVVGIEVCVTIVLMLLCGLMVAVQRAVGDVNRHAIKNMAEEGDNKAKKLVVLMEKSHKTLANLIILVVFSGFVVGEMITYNHANTFGDFLERNNVPFPNALAIVVLAIVTSLVFLVFTVFVPRQVARQHTEGVALALAGFGNIMISVIAPFAVVTSALSNVILKLFRQKTGLYEEAFSEENVISMLEMGQETGALKEEGKKMINSIFAFDDKLAYEIMTPRTDVFAIDIQDEKDEYMDELMEMRYSRIPVYDDDSDNIIGILNIKDYLIRARTDGFEEVDIKSILREPFFVPETKNIDSLFFELQKTKQHIAILIDEYGGFSGIVTMEDIIEEVMGDIDDEYDEEEHEIEEIAHNKYLIDGYMNLDDINEELNTNLESEDSETVGGLIIDILGEIPDDNPDEKIVVTYENYEFEVVNVRDRRIERIIMTIKPKSETNEDDSKEEKQESK